MDRGKGAESRPTSFCDGVRRKDAAIDRLKVFNGDDDILVGKCPFQVNSHTCLSLFDTGGVLGDIDFTISQQPFQFQMEIHRILNQEIGGYLLVWQQIAL